MGWSIRLFDVGGTAVRIHLTFFLLLAWIAAIHWTRGGPAAAVDGVLFIVLLFACVLLHEFGHVFAARRYGIGTSDVTLLPIGGLASLERMPEKPSQEIFVALAGPAVNLVIALMLVVLLGARFDLSQVAQLQEATTTLAGRVAAANVALCVFNLIPAFPMDGGRVLRALLAIPMGYTRATRVAATIGQGLAFVFAFFGLMGNPLLILIAVFIFLAASGEAGYVQAREYTRGYLASHAMITTFQTLKPSSSVDDAAALLLRTTQQEFPVVDAGGVLQGVLTREAMIAALQSTGGATPVVDVMDRDVPTVPENACLDNVFQSLQRPARAAIGNSLARRHRRCALATERPLTFAGRRLFSPLTYGSSRFGKRTHHRILMAARIYKPAKTAMQSGPARTKEWVLEYEPEAPREIDPLMGWTSSRDMKSQLRLAFETKEEAIAYAERNGIAYRLLEPQRRAQVRKSYSDNFRFGRKGAWTH
jgi:Zn-dependent protease